MVQEEPAESWRNNNNNNNHHSRNNSHSSTSSIIGDGTTTNGGGVLPLLKQSSASSSTHPSSPSRSRGEHRPRPPPIASLCSLLEATSSHNKNDALNGTANNNNPKNKVSSFFERPRAANQKAKNTATATTATATVSPILSRPPSLFSHHQRLPIRRCGRNTDNMMIAMSRAESIILSSLGDVLVCRCRNSPYPAFANAAICPKNNNSTDPKSGVGRSGAAGNTGLMVVAGGDGTGGTSLENKVAIMCCDVECDDLSATVQDASALCSPWNNNRQQQQEEQEQHQQQAASLLQRQRSAVPLRSSSMSFPVRRARSTGSASTNTNNSVGNINNRSFSLHGGLLGGSPAEVAPSPLHLHHPQHHQLQQQGGSSPQHHAGEASSAAANNFNSPDRSTPLSSSYITTGPSPSPPLSSLADRAHQAFRSPPINNMGLFSPEDEESIVPIRSFDYSHFYDGGNDMVPEQQQRKSSNRAAAYNNSVTTPSRITRTPSNATINSSSYHQYYQHHTSKTAAAHNTTPSGASTCAPVSAASANTSTMQFENEYAMHQFSQGVASFLPCFAYVKVTKVSAHALGSHVLLISDAGLLYSYGLNDYGQLGIGITTSGSSKGGGGSFLHRGYIMTPTIVTPLIENGGKAIACAAGVSHSLVVVSTEERRLIKTSVVSSSTAAGAQPSTSAAAAAAGNDAASCSTLGTLTSAYSTEAIVHHQMYGFGRNDFMKIGLKSATLPMPENNGLEMEVVKLPRRVNLRCKVKPSTGSSCSMSDDMSMMPPAGIFAIAASAEHSAALVRRASGDVELYTWGNAMYGSLGLPPAQQLAMGGVGLPPQYQHPSSSSSSKPNHHHHNGHHHDSPAPVDVVPCPSFVASLSRTSNTDVQVSSLLLREHAEYPCAIALGRRCSFVTTSLGRCFSFGESTDGMLGHGQGVTEMHTPSEICFPDQDDHHLVSVSAGACHVIAVTMTGKAYGWGLRLPAGLATRPEPTTTTKMTIVAPVVTQKKMPLHRMSPHPMPDASAVNNNLLLADHQPPERAVEDIAWSPEPVTFRADRKVFQSRRNLSKRNTHHLRQHSQNQQHQQHQMSSPPPPERVVEVCAGYDSSLFVGESGLVFSCGRASGRLGLGEQNQNVYSPRPLFGGLRLWKDVRPPPVYQQQQHHATTASTTAATETTTTASSSPAPPPPPQNRRHSLGHSLLVVSASLSRVGAARSSSAGTIERKKAPPAPTNRPKLRRLHTLD